MSDNSCDKKIALKVACKEHRKFDPVSSVQFHTFWLLNIYS